MSAAEKKPMVCKRCKAAGRTGDRRCDVAGCGRVCCAHLSKRSKGDVDTCGACNLRAARGAGKVTGGAA